MLISPYGNGLITYTDNVLDWSIKYAGNNLVGKEGNLAAMVSTEVAFTIRSDTPVFDSAAGH